jgi:hypothetical protein
MTAPPVGDQVAGDPGGRDAAHFLGEHPPAPPSTRDPRSGRHCHLD